MHQTLMGQAPADAQNCCSVYCICVALEGMSGDALKSSIAAKASMASVSLLVHAWKQETSVSQGNFSHSLAEWAMTACLFFAKDVRRLQAAKAAQKWEPFAVEELR